MRMGFGIGGCRPAGPGPNCSDIHKTKNQNSTIVGMDGLTDNLEKSNYQFSMLTVRRSDKDALMHA